VLVVGSGRAGGFGEAGVLPLKRGDTLLGALPLRQQQLTPSS
jgi:hypothetical protein